MKNVIVFTDGASRGNPGPGGWGVVISDGNKVIELGGRENNTTNNRMEMQAAIVAIQYLHKNDLINAKIHTDSAYLINGATKWLKGWQENSWITKTKDPVKNSDLWAVLASLLQNIRVTWVKVSGHSGVSANERVDIIATSFADNKSVKLFSGFSKDYDIDLNTIKNSSKKAKKKNSSRQKAYSYVSMVNGKIHIDKIWGDCEKRVKGVSGARFKKALSKYDEERIVESFKV